MLLALNDNFVLSMKVFLLSLLKTNPWFNLDILLLSDGQLSEKNVIALKNIYNNIRVINAKKEDYLKCLPTSQTWGFNLYYRFDVFDLNLDYDRVIIFDSDMVFLNDVRELFTYNQDFAACQKYLGIPEICPGNEFEQNRKRFNCGLMSISRKLLEDKSHKLKLIELAEKTVWSSDQPVFNVYFADSVYYLPQEYNIVSSIATISSLKTAKILQYHGFAKPWHSENPEQCFEEFVKKEIVKNAKLLNTITSKLKKIFDDYSKQAEQYV